MNCLRIRSRCTSAAEQRGVTRPDEAPAYGMTQDMDFGSGMGLPAGARTRRQAHETDVTKSVRYRRTPESCDAIQVPLACASAAPSALELDLETDRKGIEIGVRHFVAFRFEA